MNKRVSQLVPGDVLVGSGFTVLNVAVDIRDRGRLLVEGFYPLSARTVRAWSKSTNVTVR